MLSPTDPASPVILWFTFAALIGLLVYRAVRKERRDYQRFKRFERTRNRQRMMRKWLVDSLTMFGGAAVVIIALSWRFVTPLLGAVEGWPISVGWRRLLADTGGLVPGVAAAIGVALLGGTIFAVALARKTDDLPTIGDIGALLPRNRAELVYGALLSVNAGVVEELLFRFALPALIFGASGSALAAVVGSVALFGVLHLYQGWPGILGATVIGSLLMALYLATGSIVVAVIVHVLIDLRSLVLIPMLVFAVHRTRG